MVWTLHSGNKQIQRVSATGTFSAALIENKQYINKKMDILLNYFQEIDQVTYQQQKNSSMYLKYRTKLKLKFCCTY